MFEIKGNNIRLTRGDSLYVQISLMKDGETYTPEEGDVIRFAMKKHYLDSEALVTKTVPTDTMILHLEPSDTKELDFGKYVYDLEITFADGDVDTFINEAEFTIGPEVI